jgi:hypothetical protein
MTEAEVAKPLNPKEYELLAYLEQEYLLHGAVPTKDSTLLAGVATSQLYDKSLKSASFRHAMLNRGITLRGLDGNAGGGILTEEQLVAANTMLDLTDNRSRKKKLMDLSVSSAKWEGWLRDPVFQSYIRTRAENILGDNIHESHLALVDRVKTGDINAIKYFNEITGRYVPNASDKADVNAVLMMVLEVIQRHVRDPASLSAIGDELVAIGKQSNPSPSRPVGMARRNLVEIEEVGMGF